MTITVEALQTALSPFATVLKREAVEIDLQNVAAHAADRLAKAATAENPAEALQALKGDLGEMVKYLDGVSESDSGCFAPSGELTDKFAAKGCKPGSPMMDEEEKDKAEKGAPETETTPPPAAPQSETTTKDEDGWPSDMSPARGATSKSDRDESRKERRRSRHANRLGRDRQRTMK